MGRTYLVQDSIQWLVIKQPTHANSLLLAERKCVLPYLDRVPSTLPLYQKANSNLHTAQSTN